MAQILNFVKPHGASPFLLGLVQHKLVSNSFDVRLQSTGESLRVLRCASCLLEPMPGDEVILLNINGQFYLTNIVTQNNPGQQVITAQQLNLQTQEFNLTAQKSDVYFQEFKFNARRLWAKIPFLEAWGGHWLGHLKKYFIKSQETMHDLGHYVLDTDSMHEAHKSLKILKAPLLVEKTETHHINTEKFLLD